MPHFRQPLCPSFLVFKIEYKFSRLLKRKSSSVKIIIKLSRNWCKGIHQSKKGEKPWKDIFRHVTNTKIRPDCCQTSYTNVCSSKGENNLTHSSLHFCTKRNFLTMSGGGDADVISRGSIYFAAAYLYFITPFLPQDFKVKNWKSALFYNSSY